jgi:hypothetical protein
MKNKQNSNTTHPSPSESDEKPQAKEDFYEEI